MRVMGIDPGSLCTGYGIVEETGGRLTSVHFGSIASKSKSPFAHRLKTIYDGLALVMAEYQPDAVAVEDVFFATNAKSTIKLGQTRGVALLAAAKADITWPSTHRWRSSNQWSVTAGRTSIRCATW